MSERVLLVGWDAADWKVIHPLLDAGEMPNLARLVEQGVCGNLLTLRPVLSPMLWTSIATGQRAFKHGVLGFMEPDAERGGVRPVSVLSRKSKALWNILQQSGLRSHVVGWWPSHPAEPISGVMVSDQYAKGRRAGDGSWPLDARSVHPAEWSERLAPLRVCAEDLGLEHLEPFVPRVSEIDQAQDRRVYALAEIVAEAASVQAAATAVIEDEPWDFMAVYFNAIDHLSHGFMRYYPPRRPWVDEESFALYQHVVRSGYRFHDLMLGALLDQAGDDTTVIVVSDHGFHPDHLRPRHVPVAPAGPAVEHRPYGVFVMKGPGIRRDERVYGATLLDVTPTILQRFGLPIGRDMDGRVLASAFEVPPEPCWIDSWEGPGDSGQHPADARLDPVETQESLNQLAALGYVEPPSGSAQQNIDRATRELTYNRAQSLVDGYRDGEAAPLFARLWEQWPDETRFGVDLLSAQLALGRTEEARASLERLIERKRTRASGAIRELRALEEELASRQTEPSRAEARRLRDLRAAAGTNQEALASLSARVLEAEGRLDDALVALEGAMSVPRESLPYVLFQRGHLLCELERWTDAEADFRALLEIDPIHAEAESGLARVCLATKRDAEAAAAAQNSLALRFHNPRAHYQYGVASSRLGDRTTAVRAFETALVQNPNFADAHACLEQIFDAESPGGERAALHRRLASEARKRADANRQAQTSAPAELGPAAQSAKLAASLGADRFDVPQEEVITIVSGLPRSGTSMMMQMLAAGGHPILSDEERAADEHNPRGYLEVGKAKQLRSDASWLADAPGSAVKVVTQLLRHLDSQRHYSIVFMERSLDEVILSQERMLSNTGQGGARLEAQELARVFAEDTARAKRMIAEAPHLRALCIDYRAALERPREVAGEVAQFLGLELDVAAMAEAVEPSLYRSRC